MPSPLLRIVQFAPIDWEELARTGFRKTSGAMFKALHDATSVHELLYVQTDRRWGLHFAADQVDERTRRQYPLFVEIEGREGGLRGMSSKTRYIL